MNNLIADLKRLVSARDLVWRTYLARQLTQAEAETRLNLIDAATGPVIVAVNTRLDGLYAAYLRTWLNQNVSESAAEGARHAWEATRVAAGLQYGESRVTLYTAYRAFARA